MTRMLQQLVLLVLCSALCVQAAAANDADPDRHYQAGMELARRGELQAARSEFALAQQISPHPTTLYMLGKLSIELEDWSVAEQYLREYLSSDLRGAPSEQVAEVRAAVLMLGATLPPAAVEADAPPSGDLTGQSPDSPHPPASMDSQHPAEAAPIPEVKSRSGRPARSLTSAKQRGTAAAALTDPNATHPRALHSPSSWHIGAGVATSISGTVLLLAGAALWWWNDNRYETLQAERTALQRQLPVHLTGKDDLERGASLAGDLGRNHSDLVWVQRVDGASVSLVGVGVVALSTGLWLTLGAPSNSATAFNPRGITLRW